MDRNSYGPAGGATPARAAWKVVGYDDAKHTTNSTANASPAVRWLQSRFGLTPSRAALIAGLAFGPGGAA